MGSEKNYDIEALRSVAIAITMAAHANTLVREWSAAVNYFWLGGGVDLFFCISGFLITKSLLETKSENRPFKIVYLEFLTRRAFRLWPAAVFWAALALIASISFNNNGSFGAVHDVTFNALFGILNTANLYIYSCVNDLPTPCQPTALWHYWSLSLEEQFYLALPVVLVIARRKYAYILLLVPFAVSQTFSERPFGTLLWFIRSDSLIYGVTIAILWNISGQAMRNIFNCIPRKAVQCVLCVSIPCLVLLSRPDFPFFMGVVSLLSAIIVFSVSSNEMLITRNKLNRSIVSFIGARSYSLYLLHMPLYAFGREVLLEYHPTMLTSTLGRVASLMLCILVSFILAEISHKFIETPLRRFGRAITFPLDWRRWKNPRGTIA